MHNRRGRGHGGCEDDYGHCHGHGHGHGRDRHCDDHDRRRCDDGPERRDCCESGRDRERREVEAGERGDGPDTRFLQLEMSQVLYAEAESVTRDALRALLLEAAKARLRERFGNRIAGLAELAADELMADIVASLNIEARIDHRRREGGRLRERLSDIFTEGGASGEDDSQEAGEPGDDDAKGSRPRRRNDDEGGSHEGNP